MSKPDRNAPALSVPQALQRILAGLQPVGTETLALDRVFGRVLAQPIAARRTQPPFRMAAMDGWALRLADATTTLRCVGEVPAGQHYLGTLNAGEAVRIMTGAPMPEGADALLPLEDAEEHDGLITAHRPVAAGRHIRPVGLDFASGQQMLAANRVLHARDVALLAAMDVPWVAVRRKPRVAVLATGDELVRPGEPLSAQQIIATNYLGLSGLITAAGGEAIDLGIARDNADSLRDLALGARGADLLVTIGGASVGDYDLVRQVLGEAGLSLDFWKVAMRPGRPLMSGRIHGTPYLGLPGYPVSAMICGVLFLVPAVRALLGLSPEVPLRTATVASALPANDHRAHYLRARIVADVDGDWQVEPFAIQDNYMISTLAAADVLIARPPHAPAQPAGDRVQVIVL